MAAPDRDGHGRLPWSVTETHLALVAAGALSVVGVGVELVVHEAVHVAVNVAATGRISDCGTFGPFISYYGRLGVCYAPGGVPAVNDLLTPVVMSGLGLVSFFTSPRLRRRSLRWAAFAVGVYAWLFEALYSMAYYVPPTVTASGVEYHGDGTFALATYGHVAQVPGAVLLALGLLALSRRVTYRG